MNHTRTSTVHGPDYCAECSHRVQEWVAWPCPTSVIESLLDPPFGAYAKLQRTDDDDAAVAIDEWRRKVADARVFLAGTPPRSGSNVDGSGSHMESETP